MKTKLLLIVAATLAACTLRAAEIEIRDADHVLVDGIDQGPIVDAARNARPETVTALQTAIRAWALQHATGKADAEALRAAIVAAAKSGDAEALAAKVAEAELAKKSRDVAAIEKQIAELQAKKAEIEAAEAAAIKAEGAK